MKCTVSISRIVVIRRSLYAYVCAGQLYIFIIIKILFYTAQTSIAGCVLYRGLYRKVYAGTHLTLFDDINYYCVVRESSLNVIF